MELVSQAGSGERKKRKGDSLGAGLHQGELSVTLEASWGSGKQREEKTFHPDRTNIATHGARQGGLNPGYDVCLCVHTHRGALSASPRV